MTEKLKRSLNLPMLVFYGTGTILGLGIYVLLGKVVGAAGMLAPLAFLVAALIAGLTGLSYGELSARIPKSAGEVNYVDHAFGVRHLSMGVGWLIIISAIISTSTVVNGYVGYVHVFIELPPWLIIAGITLVLGGVGAWGITESAWTITTITIIEFAGLVVVIAVASDNLAAFPQRWREFLPVGGPADSSCETIRASARSRRAVERALPPREDRRSWRSSRSSAFRTWSTWPRRRRTPSATCPEPSFCRLSA